MLSRINFSMQLSPLFGSHQALLEELRTNVTRLESIQSRQHKKISQRHNDVNNMTDRFEADLHALILNTTLPCMTTPGQCGCGFTITTEGCFFIMKVGQFMRFNEAEAACQTLSANAHLPRVDSAVVGTLMFTHIIIY